MTTRRSGFTLIELLVVVAIISIIAAIGFVAYSGYVEAAKKKTAENAMMQLSLAQTEYYSDYSEYYKTHSGATCAPDSGSSGNIEKHLLSEADLITDEILLSIPMAPSHDYDCGFKTDKGNIVEEVRKHPFDVLKNIKIADLGKE